MTARNQPVIDVRNISFAYQRPVLRDISFSVGKGEILAIIGPNGTGKSTLLKLLNRSLDPGAGEILIGGRPIRRMRRKEIACAIGCVAQDTPVRFPLTVLEFVLQARFAYVHGLGFESTKDLDAAEWAMRETCTAELAAQRIDEISGGERQRVLLARALAAEPGVLLLDELTASLDVAFQLSMMELIFKLAKQRGIAAIVVTHELNLAAEFGDRILALGDGRIAAYGTPGEVMQEDFLRELFQTSLVVDRNPASDAPRITITRRRES